MNFLIKCCCPSEPKTTPTSSDKPVLQPPVNETPRASTTPNPNRIKKHLICDDAYANRLVLSKYLTMFGCKFDEAENGLVAVDKVKALMEENCDAVYDIIWMDIRMPKMDGFDATTHIVETLGYRGVIIGLTGYVDEETVRDCHMAGMKHVVSKPFDKKVIKMYCDKY